MLQRRVCWLLAAAAAAHGSYMEPMVDRPPPACALGNDSSLTCHPQQTCEAVPFFGEDAGTLWEDFPDGFRMCFHNSAFDAAGLDLATAFVVALCTVLAASAGCGGGGLYAPVLLTLGGFLSVEAAPLVQAAVAGNAVAQTAVYVLTTRDVNYAMPLRVLPVLLPGYLLGQYMQTMLPPTLLFVVAALILLGALWHASVWAAEDDDAGNVEMTFAEDATQVLCLTEVGSRADLSQDLTQPPSEDEGDRMGTVTSNPVAPSRRGSVARGARAIDAPTQPRKLSAALEAFSAAQTSTPWRLAAATGVFWGAATVLGGLMATSATCSAGYAGLAAGVVALAVVFVFVGDHLAPAQGAVSNRTLRGVGFVLGVGTGVVGLGAGELSAVLFLAAGLVPEVAAATAAYSLAWMGTSGLVVEVWRAGDSQFLDVGYLLFYALVAGVTATGVRLVAARWPARGAVAVSIALKVFIVLNVVLLVVVYATEGVKDAWPPQSPCRAAPDTATNVTITFKDHGSRDAAAARLGDLGLADMGELGAGLSTGMGDGFATVELAMSDRRVAVIPAAFHTNATVLGIEATPIDVVQTGARTALHVYLAGNLSEGLMAMGDTADREAAAAVDASGRVIYGREPPRREPLRRHVHALGLNSSNLHLGQLVPGLGKHFADMFQFPAAAMDIINDPSGAAWSLLNDVVQDAVRKLADKALKKVLGAPVAEAVAVLGDAHVVGALHPRIREVLDVLRDPSLDGALALFQDPAASANESLIAKAFDVLKDPSLEGVFELVRDGTVLGVLDPRIADALDAFENPLVKEALAVLQNPSITGALDVLADPAVRGHLPAEVQGAVEALDDIDLHEAFRVLKNPSVGGALAILADVADAAGVDPVIMEVLEFLQDPSVKEALDVVTNPAIMGKVDLRIRGAVEVLRGGNMSQVVTFFSKPSFAGALAVLTDAEVFAALPDGPLKDAVAGVRDPRFRGALQVLQNPSIAGAIGLLKQTEVYAQLDARLKTAVDVLQAPSVKEALGLLTDPGVLGALDPRVSAAVALLDGDSVADVVSVLRDGRWAAALDTLTAPGLASELTDGVAQAVGVLKHPDIAGSLAALRDATSAGALDAAVMRALAVLKKPAVLEALDLLQGGGGTTRRVAYALSGADAAVATLTDPAFLRVLDALHVPGVSDALDLLTDRRLAASWDGRVDAVLDVLRGAAVDQALAVLRDASIDVPLDPVVRGALAVLRGGALGDLMASLKAHAVGAAADGGFDVRKLAQLALMRTPGLHGAMGGDVRDALAVLGGPSLSGLLDLLQDATLPMPADARAAAAVEALRSPLMRGALGFLGNPSVKEALALFGGGSDVGVSARIGHALDILRKPTVERALSLLADAKVNVPMKPVLRGAIGVLKDPSLQGVLRVLRDPSVTGAMDPRIQDALQKVTGAAALGAGDGGLREAVGVLHNPSVKAVFEALAGSSLAGADAGVEDAVGFLRDPSVVRAMGVLGDHRIAEALGILGKPGVKGALALVLSPSVENALALLQDPDTLPIDPRLKEVLAAVPAIQQALQGDFSGLLDMSPPALRPFAELLSAVDDGGLNLAGKIPFPKGSNVDLSKGVISEEVLDFELATVAPATIALGNGVSIDEGTFRVQVTRNNTDGEWDVNFDVGGTFVVDIDGTPLRVPCSVGAPSLGEITVAASIEATSFEVDGVQLELREVAIEGSLALRGGSVSGSLAFRADTTVKGTRVALAGAVLAGDGGFYLYGLVEELSLGGMLDATEAMLGLDGSTFDFIGAVWREGVVVQRLAVAVASADMADVDPLQSGETVDLVQGFMFDVTLDIRGFVSRLSGAVGRDGFEITGEIIEADLEALGPIGDHVSIDGLEGSLAVTWGASRSTQFYVKGNVTLFGVDLELLLATSDVGGKLDVLVYAHAEPEPSVLSIGAMFETLKGTVADEIKFESVTFIYSTEERKAGFPGVPALDGTPIDKGFTLQAMVGEFNALNSVFGGGGLPAMPLRAVLPYAGALATKVELQMPDWMAVDLGDNCRAHAPLVEFHLTLPMPGVAVVFPLDISLPEGDILPVVVGLELTSVDATAYGTITDWWETPFGVKGLAIGPETHVEIKIIYATFFTTGLPSAIGLRGGLRAGKLGGEMAVRVSKRVDQNVLYGRITALDPTKPITPNDLIGAFGSSADLDVEVDDYFTISNLEAVIASGDGALGSLEYRQGFSFSMDVAIQGTAVSASMRVAPGAFEFRGSVAPFEIGPLEVKGATGANLTMAMSLSKDSQYLHFDGTISLFGLDLGVRVEVRGVAEVMMYMMMDFGDIFQFECTARSIGQDRIEGFHLEASMRTDVLNWVTDQIMEGLNILDELLDKAQMDVEEAERDYRALYDPAYKKLADARNKVDALREELRKKVLQKTDEVVAAIAEKREELEAKAKEWGEKIRAQKEEVTRLQAAFERALKAAEEKVERARAQYNAFRDRLKDKLDRAKRDFTNTMRSLQSKVDSARREADEAYGHYSYCSRRLSGCRWYQVGCKVEYAAKKAYYWSKHKALMAAYYVADGALWVGREAGQAVIDAAQSALWKIGSSVEKIAFDTAQWALRDVAGGAAKGLADAARATLEGLGNAAEDYGPHAIAAKALKVAEEEGAAVVRAAVEELDDIAQTTTHAVFDAAEQSLKAVEEGTAAVAFKSAQLALGATQDFVQTLQDAGDGLFRLESLDLSAAVVPRRSTWAFDASLKMMILGHEVNLNMAFEPGKLNVVSDFIDKLLINAQRQAQKFVADLR